MRMACSSFGLMMFGLVLFSEVLTLDSIPPTFDHLPFWPFIQTKLTEPANEICEVAKGRREPTDSRGVVERSRI
jgi:hypothetical protein